MVTKTKYTDPEARYISLVGRGANQIPLKIIKQDKGAPQMLNISNLIKKVTKSAKEPVEIVAVATTKDPALLDGFLKEHELEPVKVTKSAKDGNLITIQEVEDESGLHAVQVSKDLTVIVKGFTPWAEDLVNLASFAEVVKADSFFANVYDASDALSDVIRHAMWNSDSKDAAKTEISGKLNEFKDYVLSLIDGLPIVAFKMDKALDEAEQALAEEVKTQVAKSDNTPDPEPTPSADPEPKKEGEDDGKEPEKDPTEGQDPEPAKDPEPTPEPTPETEPEKDPKEEGAQSVAQTVQKTDNAFDIGALATAIGNQFAAAMQPLNEKLDQVIQKSAQVDEQIEDVKTQVQKTAKTVSTTVASTITKSDSTPDDEPEEFKGTGCIDTAFYRPELK